MRILVVEDEVIVAFLEAALLDEGHRVVGFARDARSAKVLAGDKRPDLALVDVHLTDGETGLDVARPLTGIGIPVLFMTANADLLPDDLAGALGVIPKPVAEHVLKRAVDYAVARNSGEQFGIPPEGLIVGK